MHGKEALQVPVVLPAAAALTSMIHVDERHQRAWEIWSRNMKSTNAIPVLESLPRSITAGSTSASRALVANTRSDQAKFSPIKAGSSRWSDSKNRYNIQALPLGFVEEEVRT
jgi:hypothetical protein